MNERLCTETKVLKAFFHWFPLLSIYLPNSCGTALSSTGTAMLPSFKHCFYQQFQRRQCNLFLVTSQTWDGHCSWFLSCVSYLDPILGSKKGSQKNFPTCQVKEDLSGQLVRGQPMLIGEPTCNKRRLRIEISVQGHLESYVFLEKGSGARWVLWVHSQRWKQEEEALHISPLRLSGGKSGFLFT